MLKFKTIVCLANSQKCSGHCIAGKEINGNQIGSWIRPVSSRYAGELKDYECQLNDGSQPKPLDIIKIPIKQHYPNSFQNENYLIQESVNWERTGSLDIQHLYCFCDRPSTLWNLGYHCIDRQNDSFPSEHKTKVQNSLILIRPESLTIQVKVEKHTYGDRRRTRALFKYRNVRYIIPITDTKVEETFLHKKDGDYPINYNPDSIYLCISLGLPYKGFCYKLCSAVIGL